MSQVSKCTSVEICGLFLSKFPGWGDGMGFFLTVSPGDHTEIYRREQLFGQITHKKCVDNSTDTL